MINPCRKEEYDVIGGSFFRKRKKKVCAIVLERTNGTGVFG